jgi:hypothetical protein
MAREVAGVAENPVGALEELTGGKMLLILLGVGVLGGGIYYLATKNSAAVAAPVTPTPGPPGTVIAPAPGGGHLTFTTTAPAPTTPNAPAPTPDQIVRPAGPGHFGTPMPAGPGILMVPNNRAKALVRAGQYLNLLLPTGATWNKVDLGAISPKPVITATVDLGSDNVSPISIPRSLIANTGSTLVSAGWTNASGQQASYVDIILG